MLLVEYEADFSLLRIEGEAAVAEVRATHNEEDQDFVSIDLPVQQSSEKSQNWVEDCNKGENLEILSESPLVKKDAETVLSDTRVDYSEIPLVKKDAETVLSKTQEDISGEQSKRYSEVLEQNNDILTSFLLKKDVMPKRLRRFNEKPHSYRVWKATFSTVMKELKVVPDEEIDLLVNHLGTESQMWAESLRASCASDPERGLRLIWERLDHCYGSAEKIEASLKTRLDKFPPLTSRDNRKLFELSDLLLEVESAKADSKFATSFAVYDSSSGVNSIVNKLPRDIQQKWITRAAKYKQDHLVTFPPFSVFVDFVREISKVRNDPAFQFDTSSATDRNADTKPKSVARGNTHITNRRTGVHDSSHNDKRSETSQVRCPIHKSGHKLTECHFIAHMSWEERCNLLKEKGICYKCLSTSDHAATKCQKSVACNKCKKTNHLTAMHRDNAASPRLSSTHGGESDSNVNSKCTSLCGKNVGGRSCGKIVLVDILDKRTNKTARVYAILDDMSNRSLIGPDLCDKLGVSGNAEEYTLSSCSGSAIMSGRRVSGLTVTSLDGSASFELPLLVECDEIPQDISEIPTPEVTLGFPHLRKITSSIPHLTHDCGIQLLIGRDLPAVHHVKDQIIGPRDAPFAVQLPLGWVVVGEVCLGKYHRPNNVQTYHTQIGKEGRSTIFRPCPSILTVKEPDTIGEDVFRKSPEDDKVGLSAEDREFLQIMNQGFSKDESGLWTAPLPFKTPRPTLADNRGQAFKRAILLKKSLEKNPKKCKDLVKFMQKIFDSEAAEVVSDSADETEERWYLPLFGVYNAKKPDKIRGVFDSSVVFQGQSLNDQLLSGPNLTNSLLGVLLRFRRDKYAISADVEQMFYRFLVDREHRDFLRFVWYENNNPERPLSVFRMRVHVFGNRPSPAVATYGLRKATEAADPEVQQFVARDFYVDDAMMSRPTREEAVSLLKRTRKALQENGHIHLHKVASNDAKIMSQFPKEELDSTLKDLDLDDTLPAQQSLGLTWDINRDMFLFTAPGVARPFTRRGLLSAGNSVFDPIGFVAPFTISGKILLRKSCPDGCSWDDPLPTTYQEDWSAWKTNLEQLHGYQIPRMYIAFSLSEIVDPQVYIYSDASEAAIAAAAYLVHVSPENTQIGFLMGKAKLAPKSGHSIPRLELCAAVLATEVGTFVSEQLNIPASAFKFFSDSMVVLGYICNRTRRFYTYVSNRVAQIHAFSSPAQWSYVPTEKNPADAATRSSFMKGGETLERWHSGPTYILSEESKPKTPDEFLLQSPEEDKEIRPEIVVRTTNVETRFAPISDVFERFSTWKGLVAAFSVLKHIARTYANGRREKSSVRQICKESSSPAALKDAEKFVLTELQKKHYAEELQALKSKKPISKNSSIISLSPYLDEDGLLRVGGRLRKLRRDTGIASVNPLVVPKGHVATLLVRHYHQQIFHQGRHFTEGAIRANGFWIIGAKRLVCSVLHQCVTCRKLRGPLLQQKMADLPRDRLSPGPPFTAVGVDVFGPWEIITRKTRGGVANGKRWAVMFTCLTTRAAHIEVIEDMSMSCFINALRRLVAIRGPVRILRSDRGSNFVGAADSINAEVIDVEDQTFQRHLNNNGILWYFNAPHASHMGGVWERAIGVARRILDSMLLNNPQKNLTHEVLCTFMAEVTAVMNSRPLVAIDTDSSDPLVLSPDILLTQKQGVPPTVPDDFGLKDCYRAQWKHVQVLSDIFWKRWREGYLDQLQTRRKWQTESSNLKKGDVVLLRDKALHRNHWPMAVVQEAITSDDDLVRKATVRCLREGKVVTYTRPVCEMVLLVCD